MKRCVCYEIGTKCSFKKDFWFRMYKEKILTEGPNKGMMIA